MSGTHRVCTVVSRSVTCVSWLICLFFSYWSIYNMHIFLSVFYFCICFIRYTVYDFRKISFCFVCFIYPLRLSLASPINIASLFWSVSSTTNSFLEHHLSWSTGVFKYEGTNRVLITILDRRLGSDVKGREERTSVSIHWLIVVTLNLSSRNRMEVWPRNYLIHTEERREKWEDGRLCLLRLRSLVKIDRLYISLGIYKKT